MNCKYSPIVVFLLFCMQNLSAQHAVTVHAATDKNRILIGETFFLKLDVTVPKNKPILFFTIDSIPHFEFSFTPEMDTIRDENGITVFGNYTITSFDSGHWVIPSFTIAPGIRTDTIPVDVVFSDFNPDLDYHDIKDILPAREKKKKNKWWFYVAGALIITGGIYYFLTRKKKPGVPVVAVPSDPYAIAMKDLDLLQCEKAGTKEYYSRLAGIFRLYLWQRKGILSLQKTTTDLVEQLKFIGFESDIYDQVAEALQLSDLVKFARYAPASDDSSKAFETIKQSIIIIEKLSAGKVS